MGKPAFETKKIIMETLPEYLTAARESFSYSVQQVSGITNISEKFITDLEQGYYHRLPADVYVKGFLRKLSELYIVDAELLISQYKKERGIHENIKKNSPVGYIYQKSTGESLYQSSLTKKFIVTPKTIAWGALGLFIVFILGYLFYQVNAISKPPKILIFEPADHAVLHNSSVLVSGRTDVGAVLTINDQPIDVDSSGSFRKFISVGPGQKILNFSAKNNFGIVSTKQISVIADYQASAEAKPKPQELFLAVKAGPNTITLTIKIDGQQQFEDSLAPGDIKNYTAAKKIIIGTTDAGSTSVQLNGKDLGKLGRQGEMLENINFGIDSI